MNFINWNCLKPIFNDDPMEILEIIKNNIISIGLVLLIPIVYLIYQFSKRITSVAHLPKNFKNLSFSGLVVSVGDGDGFKAVHLPPLRPNLKYVKEDALSIRLAGIDAPEVRCFGKPGQPFSNESKTFLKNLVEKKKVKIKVLDVDHYSRIVAIVFVKAGFFSYKNVNLEMIKSGMACVFKSRCASYGGLEDRFIKEETKAKTMKIGIWSDPNFILPQEYKKKLNKSGTN